VSDHRGRTHGVKGAMVRGRAEGHQWSSIEPESGQPVADALFRLWCGRFDRLAKAFERGSLVFANTCQILVDVLGFTLHVTLSKTLLGIGHRRVEECRPGSEYRVWVGKKQEMVAAGKNGKPGIWNESEHLNGMFGSHAIAVAERDQHRRLDRLHLLAREALPLQSHFLDLGDQERPMFRLGSDLFIRTFQYRRREIG